MSQAILDFYDRHTEHWTMKHNFSAEKGAQPVFPGKTLSA